MQNPTRKIYSFFPLTHVIFHVSPALFRSSIIVFSFTYNNEEVRLQWNSQRSPVFALQEVFDLQFPIKNNQFQIRIADFWLKDITPAVIKRVGNNIFNLEINWQTLYMNVSLETG